MDNTFFGQVMAQIITGVKFIFPTIFWILICGVMGAFIIKILVDVWVDIKYWFKKPDPFDKDKW